MYGQSNEKINCLEFKTGTFEMYVDTLRIISERNLDFQIERTALGTSKYKVFWKSDCEYDLKLIETDFELSKNNIGRVYHIKVISTKGDKYTYECKISGTDFIDIGVFKKIETL